MEERNTEDKEFQNLLAIRSQLTTLLIATTAGTIGLAYIPLTVLSCMLIPAGTFFIIRIIVSLSNNENKINNLLRRNDGN